MLQRFAAVLALVVALFATMRPAIADPKADVTALLKQFTTAFLAGDAPGLVGTCAPTSAVIDEFPPFFWHGKGCATWFAAWSKVLKNGGMTNIHGNFSTAHFVRVHANDAYGVVPFRFTWTDKRGSHWETGDGAFVLQRASGSWKIAGVGWSTTGFGSLH